MNRTLILGLSGFSGLLAIAVFVGADSRAIAGHSCAGHQQYSHSVCDGISHRSHGYLLVPSYSAPQPYHCNSYCGDQCGICGPNGYPYMGAMYHGGGCPQIDASGNMFYGGGYYPGAGGTYPYYGDFGNAGGCAGKTDQQLIQGTWKVIKATVAGLDLTGDQLAQEFQTMNFTADTATGSGREVKSGGYTIDPTKAPKEIDFADDLAGKAIYEFGGCDTLRLCVAVGNAERPTEFKAAETDAGRFLLELTREQPLSPGANLDPPTEVVPGVEAPDAAPAGNPAAPPATNNNPVPGTIPSGPLNSSAETPETILIVNLPADAKLFLLDQPSDITGATREFVTTGLPSGNNVQDYTVRIEVTRDGKVVTDQKVITLTGGERHELTFDLANVSLTN